MGKTMKWGIDRRRNVSAFTQVEVVVVAAILGLLAATATRVIKAIPGSTDLLKLQSDANILNSAVQGYLASGGKITPEAGADDVLRKLVSVTNAEYAHLVPGLSGTFIDPRITPVYQSPKESLSKQHRLLWHFDSMKFEMADSGASGIKRFDLDNGKPYLSEEEERDFVFLYSDESEWLWEYKESGQVEFEGPTLVSTAAVQGHHALPSTPGYDDTVLPVDGEPLLPPAFSHPGGNYDCADFDIVLSLSNPNEGVNSLIFHRINFGTWTTYVEEITVSPDTVVEAQIISRHAGYNNSPSVQETYARDISKLPDPVLDFSVVVDDTVHVAFTLGIPSEISGARIEYRIDGGAWTEYEGVFNVGVLSLLAVFDVEVRVVADGECYEDSDILAVSVDIASEISLDDLPPILPGLLGRKR